METPEAMTTAIRYAMDKEDRQELAWAERVRDRD
jgi:hypothetical protein